MLNIVNGSIQNELSRFFQVLDGSPVALTNVTTAAFCKARKKLSYTAFKALNTTLIDTFYQSNNVQRWRGFRLLAVDGAVTKLPLSANLMSHYGKARSFSKRPAVRVSQLYDIKNRLSVDLQVDSHTMGERNMAIKHLEYAGKNDLIIYDRGYPATWFFKMHISKGIDFCVRATLDSSNQVKEFIRSGKRDAIMEFPCIDKSLRRCRKEGIPTEAIKLRLIRVTLPTGDTEVLITSLISRKDYPCSIFGDLYQQRWGVEEDYKALKSRLNIENFSGLSVDAVTQDIHAKTLTKNLTSVAVIEAEPLKSKRCKGRKGTYRINFTHALSQMKDNVVRFLIGGPHHDLSRLLIAKISTEVNAYRSERSFIRLKNTLVPITKYPVAYKRIC